MSINDTGITVSMKDGQAIDLGDFLQSAIYVMPSFAQRRKGNDE